MPSPDAYFDAFSDYLTAGDATGLLPYLESDADPVYLQIYRNGVIKSAMQALASNYPTLKTLLGDEIFNSLARRYVLSHWPQDSSLSNYGEGLIALLQTLIAGVHINSADFAKLDRAWLDALFAADDKPLSADDLAALTQSSPEQFFDVNLVSSVRMLPLSEDSLSHWIELKFGSGASAETEITGSVILWRAGVTVHYRPLSQFERVFIKTVEQTNSIFKSAEAALEVEPNGNISHLFADLITAGILTRKNK